MSTGSFVTIGYTAYPIPDILDIQPADIWDDKEHVYRIALGKPNMTVIEEALYKPLFMRLNNFLTCDEGFISDVLFKVGTTTLTFKLAYVVRTQQQFGVFYDIEAAENEIKEGYLCE